MKKSMSEKAPLLIRLELFPMFAELTDEEAGKVFKAILDYRSDGVIPELEGRELRMIFNTIRPMIDDDLDGYREKCEKNAENGRKGGLAKASRSASNSIDVDVDDSLTKDDADEGAEKTEIPQYDATDSTEAEAVNEYAYADDDDMPF